MLAICAGNDILFSCGFMVLPMVAHFFTKQRPSYGTAGTWKALNKYTELAMVRQVVTPWDRAKHR
jgi:hypothetical protein